jgi:hypothetical protein
VRNRWYDPESGRFISEDPLDGAADNNQYTFSAGDPINGYDPTGLQNCYIKPGGQRETYSNGLVVITGIPDELVCGPVVEGGGNATPAPRRPRDRTIGGGGGHRGTDGGSTGVANLAYMACRALTGHQGFGGIYRGVSASYFVGYGLTFGAGLYLDANGPGIYVRAGIGSGIQGSVGSDFGFFAGPISGAAIEIEGVGLAHSASGSIGFGGASGFYSKSGSTGSRVSNPLPVSGHAAVTYTKAWRLADRCN